MEDYIKSVRGKIELTGHSIGQLLFGPCLFGKNQRQIVDGMLIGLLRLVIVKRTQKLLFVDFEAFFLEFKVEQFVQ